ncbi:KIN14B-interacting protein At4g14310 [Ananas comosus]|uniref:KIN14B-interacting protein At4g14310 n=1 Tax=Ananas comosus TaxID=4615 RepID=A0A199VIW0_ANACO|nr:KIN14B-interacting protein At4g14310 [Ananas comosus]OAY76943.1 hypothetical protein ACMD2_07457 [Ananas comosus]
MSSRLKDRGGGGGKIMASKPHKPLPESTPKEKGSVIVGRRTPISSGKENLRSISSGRSSVVRPNPVPKIAEKPAAAGVRWSTSSMPRGKAPNSSDLRRLMSNLRASRVSGVDRMGRTIGKDLEAETGLRRSVGGIRVLEKCQQGKGVVDSNSKDKERRSVAAIRVSENSKVCGFSSLQSVKNDSKISNSSSGKSGGGAAKVSGGLRACSNKEDFDGTGADYVELAKGRGTEMNGTVIGKDKVIAVSNIASTNGKVVPSSKVSDNMKDGGCLISTSNVQIDITRDFAVVPLNKVKKDLAVPDLECSEKETGNGVVVGDNQGSRRQADSDRNMHSEDKLSEKITVFEEASGEGKVHPIGSKYSSRLHEKLAMLEGKVQKIASEIKRTKAILDDNNPDESKLILSDIQSKISAIEKAVGNVMDGTKSQAGSSDSKKDNASQNKNVEIGRVGKGGDMANPTKGLNNEELEARFFPHHKLLRNRRSSSISSEKLSHISNEGANRKPEDGSLNYIDENVIAMEFLASLDANEGGLDKHGNTDSSEQAASGEPGGDSTSSAQCGSDNVAGGKSKEEIQLLSTETFEDLFEEDNKPENMVEQEAEKTEIDQLWEIGRKPSTGGWFVSEGEAVLLAHSDGTCSYYDIANCEIKTEYKPPGGVSPNLWGDCWLIRAPGADGCSGRYVVAASAGSSLNSGFCSWDFYKRDVTAFHIDLETPDSCPQSLSSVSSSGLSKSASSAMPATERQQWWYRPCGPLLLSTATRQKAVSAYDIRDGDLVMKWQVNNPVVGMEFSSPLQWRSRGKVVIVGTEAISLWDVNSLTPQPLMSVSSAGKRVYSLHINNTDAELGGGVRQRVNSLEVEGNDGVFCTQESVKVFDFRVLGGIGLKISRHGAFGHSIFSRGDSIFIGSTEARLPIKGGPRSQVQHYSLRKGKLVTTYELPEFNAHFHHSLVTQVWGSSSLVMAVCGTGLFVFDTVKDEALRSFSVDQGNTVEVKVKQTIGSDDLYCPTFDYLGSRVLLVSRDRPAFWRYLL